jgi:hypothetical protein
MATMAGMLLDRARLVVITANPGWSPFLEMAERLGLKMPEGEHTWRSSDEILLAACRAGLSEVSFTRSFLVPKAVPVLKSLNSARWASRLRRRYGLIQRAVFERPPGP